MVTRNGFRFGVGAFVVSVTMFLASHLSLAWTGNSESGVGKTATSRVNAVELSDN